MEQHIELIARGLLLRGQYILLCQNTRHGYWYLPGGHIEFGEAAAAALVREFREECGVPVRVLGCTLVTEATFTAKRKHHEVNVVFHVEELGAGDQEVLSQEEGVSFAWFELASIADIDVRPPAIKAWLAAGGRSEESRMAWVSEIQ